MKILITNARLESYQGTEVVVRDLAMELKRQGHEPLVYSPRLGPVAAEIKRCGIPVTDEMSSIGKTPDIIHGHHQQTLEALLHFPSVPAIYVCHGANGYDEAPFYFPRIQRYVAVDERCKQRIADVPGIPPERIGVMWNAVDLARFQKRTRLPDRPRRALVFSNGASRSTHLLPVRKACRQMGIQVDVVGLRSGNPVTEPERLLPGYDIVFAKARCALEALAVGNAVVLCDFPGLGPMVSSRNFERLQPMNFGAGLLQRPVHPQLILSEIQRYDPNDAAQVCERVRKASGLVESVQRWIQLYAEVIKQFDPLHRHVNEEYTALTHYFARWNYGSRMEWERAQINKLRSVPVFGGVLYQMARGILKKWTDVGKSF